MKNTLLTILLLIICCPFFAHDYRAKLLKYNRFDHFAVSPAEDLFFGISDGNLYKSEGFNKLWHTVTIKEAPASGDSSGDFKSVYFITNDVLIVFSKEYIGQKNLYYSYKSVDRGKTWKRIKLGKWDWINDVFIDNSKRIWVSAASTDLYCSKDMGDTWHKIKYPPSFDGQRISISTNAGDKLLFLADDKSTIHKTTDSFSDFESISSPILKTKDEEYVRPVSKFEQIGNYYIARQEDKVFYTKTDHIIWKLLANATDFVLCGQSNVYILNNDLSISLLDASMKTEWTSVKKIKYSSVLYCINNNLYTFTDRILYKINKNVFSEQWLYTNEHPIEPTSLKVNRKGEDIYFDDGDVLLFDKHKKQWYRYMTLPIDFSYAVIYNGQILLTDYDVENHYLFEPENKRFQRLVLPHNLVDLSKKKIKSFRIEKGSEGCFHFENEIEDYKYEGNTFVKQPLAKDTSRHPQPKALGLKDKKDAQTIYKLLDEINTTARNKLNINELQITHKDISAYKSYLRNKKEELRKSLQETKTDDNDSTELLYLNVVDAEDNPEDYYLSVDQDISTYEKYEILADSIWSVPDSTLTRIFKDSSFGGSTTTDWIKLSVYFDDNTCISVSNEDNYPNYLHTPWIVDYEGLKIKTNSFKIGILLNEIGENKLMLPILSDKRYAIQQIVKYLYTQKEKEGTLDKLVYTIPPAKPINYIGTIITISAFTILILCFIFIRREK